jgi:uncharacterized small protein (DUF1192 family)
MMKRIGELKAEVERLTFDPLTYLDDQGEWMPRHIHLAAVERLKAEVERLKMEQRLKAVPVEAQLIDCVAKLKAEVERLTKAGDAMASGLQGMAGERPKALADEWNDAKEGKQL